MSWNIIQGAQFNYKFDYESCDNKHCEDQTRKNKQTKKYFLKY